ncbi:hypothetical protein BX666DRAFT_2005455 [Dichotomocladium elegans]|nr:hypothetical protein BX666DRAFT_2005455 [Dichotomocladium elegans]
MIRSILGFWLAMLDALVCQIVYFMSLLQAMLEQVTNEGSHQKQRHKQQQQQQQQPPQKLYKQRAIQTAKRRNIGECVKSPVSQLPNELLTEIFELAGARHLFHATLVNRRWHHLVTPILWRAPVLSGPVCCLPPFVKEGHIMYCDPVRASDSFPVHLPKYGMAVRSLVLPPLHTTDCSVLHIARYCPNLTHIVLDDCKRITTFSMYLLSQHCSRLEAVSVSRCTLVDNTGLGQLQRLERLSSVRLAGLREITDEGVIALAKAVPLTELDVSDCSGIKCLDELAKTCGDRLTRLGMARQPLTALRTIVKHCPNLQHLNVARKSMADRRLSYLVDSLRDHDIRLSPLGTTLVRRHRALEKAHHVDQDNLDTILKGLSKLEYLDVTNWQVNSPEPCRA